MAIQLGTFQLNSLIGQGGMGEVWGGVHNSNGTPVAAKLLTGRRADDPQLRELARQEALTMLRCRHQHVCTVYQSGTVDEQAVWSSGGRLSLGAPWMVMERADGSAQALCGQCEWPVLREITLGVLAALSYVHERGFIHRDIKPANVLLLGGEVRLADFGLALSMDEGGSSRLLRGTPAFMAPEQFGGQRSAISPATDLYALACAVWALATGGPPFKGTRLMTLMTAHQSMEPPKFLPTRAVPAQLEAWLRRLLSKDPRSRYSSARAAIDALRCFSDLMRAPAAPVQHPDEDVRRSRSLLGWTGASLGCSWRDGRLAVSSGTQLDTASTWGPLATNVPRLQGALSSSTVVDAVAEAC